MSTLLTRIYLFDFLGHLSTHHFMIFRMSSVWLCKIFNMFNPLRFIIFTFIYLKLFQIYSIRLPVSRCRHLWNKCRHFLAESILQFCLIKLSSKMWCLWTAHLINILATNTIFCYHQNRGIELTIFSFFMMAKLSIYEWWSLRTYNIHKCNISIWSTYHILLPHLSLYSYFISFIFDNS